MMASDQGALRLGIDIGGTFTDLVLEDLTTRAVRTAKVLTTHDELGRGVAEGVRQLLSDRSEAARITSVMHASTIAANSLVERSGAIVALITTKGFRDIIETGREARYDLYDLQIDLPQPLVPERLRFEVRERLEPDGSVAIQLDPADIRHIARQCKALGAEAAAVCLLHSYANPSHERQVKSALRAAGFGGPIVISSEVCPLIREYERCVTTVVNSFLMPKVADYLSEFERRLQRLGLHCQIRVMASNAGLLRLPVAAARPVELLESGPAAGTWIAAQIAEDVGWKSAISFDMGGTTAKTALVEDGNPTIVTSFEVARLLRFNRGSGIPIQAPSVDLIEIGAGGGSIAWVDDLGLLKVGPLSAGSQPGPACYGRGGTEPTVTDAGVLLGHIDPAAFLGGEMALREDLARSAITSRIADPLGIDAHAAAAGIIKVVTANMARASRIHIVERGADPRSFAAVAFGGAGPVHAAGLADALGVTELLIPAHAGVMSAMGLLTAAPRAEAMESALYPLAAVRWDHVAALFDRLRASVARDLDLGADVPLRFIHSADMRYRGQGHEVVVTLPDLLGGTPETRVRAAFEETYRQRFGRDNGDAPVEILSWRVTGIGPSPRRIDCERVAAQETPSPRSSRRIWTDDAFVEVAVFRRPELGPTLPLQGPALIEEAQTTTVVPANWRWWIDGRGHMRLSRWVREP
jgi:N-methylhydantoinase A/oxoprolinase/acetone carboxylase beta subunit